MTAQSATPEPQNDTVPLQDYLDVVNQLFVLQNKLEQPQKSSVPVTPSDIRETIYQHPEFLYTYETTDSRHERRYVFVGQTFCSWADALKYVHENSPWVDYPDEPAKGRCSSIRQTLACDLVAGHSGDHVGAGTSWLNLGDQGSK